MNEYTQAREKGRKGGREEGNKRTFGEKLSAPEIAELQNLSGWVQEEVLRPNISMTDAESV